MNILFTICGRAGSKGIKNKNIRDFLGKPLPLYTLSAIDLYLKICENVSYDIVVNTDSEELANIFQNCNLRKTSIMDRKPELAGDKVPKVSVIKDCLENMDKVNYDMVVDLDITSPLRNPCDLERLIIEMDHSHYDVVFSVTESRRNPYFNMVKEREGYYERVIDSEFTARQQAPQIYDMNASLYAYAPAFLKTEKNIFEGKCGIIKMKDTGVLDLDHENDFELMEAVAEYLLKKDPEFKKIFDNIQ